MSFASFGVVGAISVQRVPFRLMIMRALSSTLEQVNPTNGFTYDMRGRVFRGRVRYGETDPIPMISILEAPIPIEVVHAKGDANKSNGNWELLVQGFVEDDKLNPTDPAHHLMAEVKMALTKDKANNRATNILGMNGAVYEMFIGQGAVRPPDEASDKAFFWLTLTLRLAEDLDNPYARLT